MSFVFWTFIDNEIGTWLPYFMMKDEISIGVKSLKIGCTQSPTLSRQGPHLSWKKWVGNQTIHWAIILTFPSISYLTFAVHVLSLGTFSGCPQLVMINDHGHFSECESEWSDNGIFHGQHRGEICHCWWQCKFFCQRCKFLQKQRDLQYKWKYKVHFILISSLKLLAY